MIIIELEGTNNWLYDSIRTSDINEAIAYYKDLEVNYNIILNASDLSTFQATKGQHTYKGKITFKDKELITKFNNRI